MKVLGARIKVVLPTPVPPEGMKAVERLVSARRRAANPDTTIDVVIPKEGPARLRSLADRFLSELAVYPEVLSSKPEGYDAVVIDCTCDQLADEGWELAGIPVVPPLKASLHVASLVGERFGIVTPNPGASGILWNLVDKYGFRSRVRTIRETDVNLLSEEGMAGARDAFLHEGMKALNEGTDVIILGCTLFTDDAWLAERLEAPVISPGDIAIKVAELLVTSRIRRFRPKS